MLQTAVPSLLSLVQMYRYGATALPCPFTLALVSERSRTMDKILASDYVDVNPSSVT